MPKSIIMPKFGFTLESCEIIEWLVKVGDEVREGDPIAEVETDKVNMEVEAIADGKIIALLYEQGDDVPVTEIIAYLAEPGENVPAGWEPPATAAPVTKAEAPSEAPAEATPLPKPNEPSAAPGVLTPVAQRMVKEHNLNPAAINGTGPKGKITRRDVEAYLSNGANSSNGTHEVAQTPVIHTNGKVAATPAARRIARERNIDLTTVAGTGPGGRVQGTDVQQAAMAPTPAPTKVAPQAQPTPATTASGGETIPLRGMRKKIATRLQASFRDAPHIFFDMTVDMGGMATLRKRLSSAEKSVSYTALIVKACAWALAEHPYMNATFDGETITLSEQANVGVAVALPQGLLVPVIHDAGNKPLRVLHDEIKDLANRARDGKLMPDELQGGTFTISNLGMYGVDRFTAIINPPQVGILSVGRTTQQFVPDDDGNPTLQSQSQMVISADHRVVDGAQVALFLNDLRAVLEEPVLMTY